MPLLGAKVVAVSPNFQVARRRGLNLYREWLRSIPTIIEIQHLDLTRKQIRDRIRSEFEKNRNITDYRVLDVLNIKGQMELEETVNQWKNKTHVMRYFDDYGMTQYKAKPKSFLDGFYSGRKSQQ